MTTLRAGIIGPGHIAQTAHIPYYQSATTPVHVVALCGRDYKRTKTVAEKFNIEKVFTDVDAMLKDSSLDLVSVCTPNKFHYENVMACLDAHCHVLCEKPPAILYNDAMQMAEKAKQAKRLLHYNFHYRQLPETAILKKEIDSGNFGKLYHIKASFLRR